MSFMIRLPYVVRRLALLLLIAASVNGIANSASAQIVNLAWDPNPETDIAGYKLYYKVGASATYNGSGAAEGASPITLGNTTFTTVNGLDEAQVNCFVVTAFNNAGEESGYSDPVCTTAVAPPQPTCTDADGDGFALEGGECGDVDPDDGNPAIYPGAPVPAPYPEFGTASVNHNLQTVNLPIPFVQPVVILGAPTSVDPQPGVVRLQNLGSESFAVRFQEWGPGAGDHGQETIPYIVLEKGRQVMADGSIWEVGTFNLSGTGTSKTQGFQQAFSGKPALFLTLQSSNDSQAVTVRATNVTPNGFDAALFEEEANTDGHGTEVVGYLAVYNPQGSGVTDINGAATPYQVLDGMVNSDFAKVQNLAIKLEEEQSLDSELAHGEEQVAMMLIEGQLFAQDVSCSDMDPVALRCDNVDTDGDGYVDSIDAFPGDPTRWEASGPEADTVAPSASVTSPVAGSQIAGATTVEVAASDNVAVSKVELYIDGSLYATDASAPYSFSIDAAAAATGSLTLLAKAYDSAGNFGDSEPVEVFTGSASGDQAPIVTIISPTYSELLDRRVIIEVEAFDDTKVERIELYVDGVLEKVRSADTLRDVLYTRRLSSGEHNITAKAFDNAGNLGQDSVVVFK